MPSMIPRRLLAGLTLLACAASVQAGHSRRPKPRVNFLILKSDEHNPKYSSVYGHPFVQTPNMERLAKLGTVYESAYCPSPLCAPSRSAFMSGRRVHEIQQYSNCNVFPGDYPTYGRVLRDQGVHTVHIGKTDVYAPGEQLGFSEMMFPGNRKPPGDRLISRNPLAIRVGGEGRGNGYGVAPNPYPGDIRNVDAGVRWLTETAPKLDQPWTMELNVVKPHFPVRVTQDLWDVYPQGGDLPKYGKECASAQHPYAQDLRKHFQTDAINEEQTRGIRRGYLGCITFVDRQLGRVLDALEQSRQLKNTVVVYTTDHGEMLGKFGMWWKCSLYEDSVRVPLIVAGPGFKAGRRVKTPVDQLDLQASIFKALGKQRPAGWAGTPLQEIATNDRDHVTFSEYHGHGTRGSAFMVRKGKWKLLHYHAAPTQLFDLEKDPEELDNLAGRYPRVVEDLEEDLRGICDPEVENERAEAMIRRQLRAIQLFKDAPGSPD